jgi:hypothetical protein
MDTKKKEVEQYIKENQEDRPDPSLAFPESFTFYMQDYYAYKTTGTSNNKAHDYAFQLYEDRYKREIIEALLLAEADPNDVQSIFGVPVETLKCYADIFFDTKRFTSRLDKLSYTENYKNKFGKELKVRSLSLGPEFIYFTYGKVEPTTENQKSLLKKMYLSSAYRAMEMNFNSMTSSNSKAAVEMAKIMIRSYESMEKLMSEGAKPQDNLFDVLTDRKLTLTAFARDVVITKEDLI